MKELKSGIYKHYKGGLYLVLCRARHSETNEPLIAYIPLGVKHGARMTVRPYEMFFEEVTVNGRKVPRFTYIGETVEPAVADWYDPLSGYRGADRVDD